MLCVVIICLWVDLAMVSYDFKTQRETCVAFHQAQLKEECRAKVALAMEKDPGGYSVGPNVWLSRRSLSECDDLRLYMSKIHWSGSGKTRFDDSVLDKLMVERCGEDVAQHAHDRAGLWFSILLFAVVKALWLS